VPEVTAIGQLEPGFFGFMFLSFCVDMNPPPAWWKCGNPACLSPDFQARWKEWETRLLSFPRFPRGGISTTLFISSCSERSDAGRAFLAA
jgi:hypothetical protein